MKPLNKRKEKSLIINYRPVSLLPVISEILEQLVQVRLESFFKNNNCWYGGQYGFRKHRSCSDATCDLIGNIIQGGETDLVQRIDSDVTNMKTISKSFIAIPWKLKCTVTCPVQNNK